MAFWEIFHFNETVRKLEGADAPKPARAAATPARPTPDIPPAGNTLPTAETLPQATDAHDDAATAPATDHVSHHERRDD